MADKEQAAIYGRRLREGRALRDVSLEDLGVAVGLDISSASGRLSRYENGIHQPKLVLQRLLARALQLPLAYFYAENDELAKLISDFGRKDEPGLLPIVIIKKARSRAGQATKKRKQ
ncbi:transcriptional regulator with XRE-family HTH domain [Xanthomonas arboricola]|uniref:helix-turn-helix domain-containing protein n=1 Tax=Xanthomonas cannabis TaxID=1885674 RepID=UPI00160C517E|nr:helix-turn-helix transcriptional regulator [Xanthomonas cannabis]MBB3804269.1 transcriptional regulator with XRE-family HTH domain [Xanthomonas cannabis]